MCGQFWKRFPNGMRKCFHHIALICTECLTCRLICSHMQQVSEAFCCAMDTKSMPPQVCEDVSSVLEKKPPSFCCYCLLRLFLCSDWRQELRILLASRSLATRRPVCALTEAPADVSWPFRSHFLAACAR